MKARFTALSLLFITILTAFSFYVVWPEGPDQYLPDFIPWPKGKGLSVDAFDFERRSMRLGLDLRGGTHIVLEAVVTSPDEASDLDQRLDAAMDIIERRVNAFGVAESEVQRQGANRISVQLPGIEPEEAERLIGRTALLEFKEIRRDESGNVVCIAGDGTTTTAPIETVQVLEGLILCPDGGIGEWVPATAQGSNGIVKPLTGQHLRSNSQVVFDRLGQPQVAFETNDEGRRLLAAITTRLIGQPLGIFLDEEFISSPIVNDALTEGRGVITGVTLSEARDLAKLLNIGALPVQMRVVQQQEVDATLGSDSVKKSVQAGEIGILAVMAFMILYYRVPGFLASAALVVYASTLMMIFKLWPVTITLAGIAAFVLSVGMAVDANILIFERMKEELRVGRSLRSAIDIGFRRAWSSIRDSNISTLITCVILYWFGDQFGASLVKGFAITLGVGVLVSMFSAIFVTRTFLHAAMETRWLRRQRSLWLAEPPTAADATPPSTASSSRSRRDRSSSFRPGLLDLVGKRHWYFLLSLLVILPGVISLLIPPALRPGIEFTSGTTFTLRFEQPVEQSDLRSALTDLGHPDARIQQTADGEFLVRTRELAGTTTAPPVGPVPPSEREALEAALRERLGNFEVVEFASVSPVVSEEIGRNAAIAVGVASLAIMVYITWAFRSVPKPLRYGTAALIALAHDVLIVLGVFSILGKAFGLEVNTMFITGVLTVIGFSVHDTIVVFDRIRENVARMEGRPFEQVVNVSLLETMGRSLNTSLTVILTLVALLLLGGATIQNFLLVLLIGFVAGTYSSIFNASQVLVAWENGDVPRFLRRFLPIPEPASTTSS